MNRDQNLGSWSKRGALAGAFGATSLWVALCAVGCGEVAAGPEKGEQTKASAPVQNKAQVGQLAPDFTLPDVDGKSVQLSALKGKTVVLEWFNPGCPFIKYAHEEGPLKALPAQAAEKGVVWLTINSNAPNTQGHGVELNREAGQRYGLPAPVLLDPTGAVGQVYGAQTTPHMYIIDPQGTLVYNGAVDNAPLGKPNGMTREAWLEEAIAAVQAGQTVPRAMNKAYGCSVKYQN